MAKKLCLRTRRLHEEKKRIEKKYSLDFGEVEIVFREKMNPDHLGTFDELSGEKCRITLRDSLKGTRLLETFYHELGHVFLWRYDASKHLKKVFENNAKLEWSREELSRSLRKQGRLPRFISFYAGQSLMEDFCETFSAFLINDGRVDGKIWYEDSEIDLRKDQSLHEKFLTVKECVRTAKLLNRSPEDVIRSTELVEINRVEIFWPEIDQQKLVWLAKSNSREVERVRKLAKLRSGKTS